MVGVGGIENFLASASASACLRILHVSLGGQKTGSMGMTNWGLMEWIGMIGISWKGKSDIILWCLADALGADTLLSDNR